MRRKVNEYKHLRLKDNKYELFKVINTLKVNTDADQDPSEGGIKEAQENKHRT